jgi:2-oxo-3-hexenedioate decarboxylase
VQGHPAEALALAANDLGRRGLAIEAAWIVLAGGMTDAVAVPPGVVLAAHFTPPRLGLPALTGAGPRGGARQPAAGAGGML